MPFTIKSDMKISMNLWLMTHRVPHTIKTSEALRFYREVARMTGRKLSRSIHGYRLI